MTQIPPPYSASIPFMVTQAMKRRLRALGRSDEDIANLTPQQAHHVLSCEWCAKITMFETGDGILSKVIRLCDGKVHCDGSACKMWEGTAWNASCGIFLATNSGQGAISFRRSGGTRR